MRRGEKKRNSPHSLQKFLTNNCFSFMQQASTLPGDVLLVTAFISYVGCFTKQFRQDLLHKQWQQFLRSIEPTVPITEGLDPLSLLTDDTQIAKWNNEGLPNDRMSTENATILTNSDRWPLMIDPQVRLFIAESRNAVRISIYLFFHSCRVSSGSNRSTGTSFVSLG